MEYQTVHLQKNEDYNGSRLFYVVLPIFAFFVIFLLFFFIASNTRQHKIVELSNPDSSVLGTEVITP